MFQSFDESFLNIRYIWGIYVIKCVIPSDL
jgi:hypothetical protein